MPAAFIQPNFTFIKEWEKIHGITVGESNTEIISNPKVIERIQEEINHLNTKFGNWEQIKRFELTPDVWSIEGGHLTPTLKLRRKIVMENIKLIHQNIRRIINKKTITSVTAIKNSPTKSLGYFLFNIL